MNSFLNDYGNRLREWYELRENLKNIEIRAQCIAIDKFWQQCPLSNHYLHPADMKDWPNPWELINENNYCVYARALGMVYTLLLLGIKDVDLVDAIDNNSEDVVLVLVDNAKYILNYWPDTVVNNHLHDFKIKKHHNIASIIRKIGEI